MSIHLSCLRLHPLDKLAQASRRVEDPSSSPCIPRTWPQLLNSEPCTPARPSPSRATSGPTEHSPSLQTPEPARPLPAADSTVPLPELALAQCLLHAASSKLHPPPGVRVLCFADTPFLPFTGWTSVGVDILEAGRPMTPWVKGSSRQRGAHGPEGGEARDLCLGLSGQKRE